MAVPAKMSDLATLAASNSPQGSDAIGNSLDDFIRAQASIIRSTNALSSASIASASTTDLGTSDAESVIVTGSVAITSFGTTPAGIKREVVFASAGSVITNSAAIVLPNAANITAQAGDVFQFRSQGSGNWKMVGPRSQLSTADIGNLTTVLAGYLPLTGGTLTGPITATVGSFSTSISTSGGLAATGAISCGNSVNCNGSGPAFILSVGGLSQGAMYYPAGGIVLGFAKYSAGAFAGNHATVDTGSNWVFTGICTGPNFVATSDRRKKKSIKKLVARDRLADLLQFCEWLWKESGEAGQGVIAQEVQKVAPEYVHKSHDGTLGVDKASLTLECVIGLAARVRSLEGK